MEIEDDIEEMNAVVHELSDRLKKVQETLGSYKDVLLKIKGYLSPVGNYHAIFVCNMIDEIMPEEE